MAQGRDQSLVRFVHFTLRIEQLRAIMTKTTPVIHHKTEIIL